MARFTLDKIISDGFKVVDKIDYLMTNSTQRSKGVGLLIEGLTQSVERIKPDILLTVGDRESLATCIVGNYVECNGAYWCW